MMRVMAGLAAWAAGTVIAVSVAWFGANVVLRNAGVGSGVPVLSATLLTPPATPSGLPGGASPGPSLAASPSAPTVPASASASASASPSSSPSPSSSSSSSAGSSGDVREYTLAGGRVTLDVTGDSVQLVTAVPDAGYSVQSWSGTDWLRVDFSSGAQVSSLIASWYEQAPSITVAN
ncbi:MAG TPA: hypothetical protein VK817_08130 [Trebonia sp.]|nr:hypothetical protein [Trebonia sp.]